MGWSRAELIDEAFTRKNDPLLKAFAALNPEQLSYVHSTSKRKLVQGGNQSGKTWTAAVDFLLDALGIHPTIHAEFAHSDEEWEGRWGCVSFELFAEQGWKHFKRLLLFPGESIDRLPTRRIKAVSWHNRKMEIPAFIELRRPDGRRALIYVKSYEQGIGQFQSAQANHLHMDEECPSAYYHELVMRTVKRGAVLSFSATPVQGERYLDDLKNAAERKEPNHFFVKLDTRRNPSLSQEALNLAVRGLGFNTDLFNLRILGDAVSRKGLVYKDSIFTPAHVIEPFTIPNDWCRCRSCDDGWNHFVCLWFAVAPKGNRIVLYREYHGQLNTCAENAAAVQALSGAERYVWTILDRATMGAARLRNEDGDAVRIIDQYREEGLDARASTAHTIRAGILEVWKLLAETDHETPRFQVFKSCEYFLDERRRYKSPDAVDDGSERPEKSDNPIKKDDHAMDAWRYAVVEGLVYRPPPPPKPPAAGLAKVLFDRRTKVKRESRI